ncbi:type II toxin-antitoxin system VapC family toxin [Variovorax rhizosphaerae]|uniref:Ribonuclease VapC n=1 Tax=Variovorax rhizosphaerae TaxID=1836200 RepID=A0ABU8WIQ0_9BURK
MALVDTNVISELLRRAPDAQVVRWFEHARDVAVSVVTVDEIVFGLTRRAMHPLRERFDAFLAGAHVLDIDVRVARRAGELRGSLSARGIVRAQPDMLIAATAQVHALTLVTRNVRDFDHCGIAVMNPFNA